MQTYILRYMYFIIISKSLLAYQYLDFVNIDYDQNIIIMEFYFGNDFNIQVISSIKKLLLYFDTKSLNLSLSKLVISN